MPEIRAVAEAEHRTPGELIRDALRDEQAWQELVAYGQETARALRLGEDDVARLIAEYRRERRQQGRE